MLERQIHRASVTEVAPSMRVPPVGPGVSVFLLETLTPYQTGDRVMLYFLTSETHNIWLVRGGRPLTSSHSLAGSLHLQGQSQAHSCPTANPCPLILSPPQRQEFNNGGQTGRSLENQADKLIRLSQTYTPADVTGLIIQSGHLLFPFLASCPQQN